MLDSEKYFKDEVWRKLKASSYNEFSIIDQKDKDRVKYSAILAKIMKQP